MTAALLMILMLAPAPASAIIDTDPPSVDFTIDDALRDGWARASFDEDVTHVSSDNLFVVKRGTSTVVPSTLHCKTSGGAWVSCWSGTFRSVTIAFDGTLLAGELYTIKANPDGVSPITDGAGNALPEAWRTFRSNLSEQEESAGATFLWDRVSKAAAYGGFYRRERTRGARATFWFKGRSVAWYTVMGRRQGKAGIYVDGRRIDTVDNYAPEATYRVRRNVRVGSGGWHRLTIKVLGRQDRRARGTWVGIDAVLDGGRLRTDPSVRYRWDPVREDSASRDRYVRSDARGARATFVFRGKGIDWYTAKGPDMGRARIELDGVVVGTVDNYSSRERYRVRRSLSGLTDTVHRLTIVVLGRKDRRADDAFVVVDKWRVRLPSTSDFRRLGAWVDLWDYGLDPADAIADMDAHGVKTLYLQTARWNSDDDIARPADVAEWIEEAHAAGIAIVGWYLPAYDQHLDKDVRRTVAIADFRTSGGDRFDALAIDIEYKGETESLEEFNEGIKEHIRRVRDEVGNSYPIGAIVPSPVGMSLSPSSWKGFPWSTIGRYGDVVMPMGYWSYRTDCDTNPDHCPYLYARNNVKKAASKTGLPVHLIGGVGNRVTTSEVADFVLGTLDEEAFGGSLYDYRTTDAEFWGPLGDLNGL